MTVVNIEDYRAPEPLETPCEVTFIGFPVVPPRSDTPIILRKVFRVENGDAMGTIEKVRQMGGVYVHAQAPDIWFLPWPCAAVHIDPYPQ